MLRSRILGRTFAVGDDAFVLTGGTRPEDLDAQLQLLTAYVYNPGWRLEWFERLQSLAPTLLEQLKATPNGVLARDLSSLLHAKDPRWGIPSLGEIKGETPADLKALLAGPLGKGPIEVVIVGDTSVDAAIKAVGATFGALPSRDPGGPDAEQTIAFPPPTPAPIVLTHTGRADQAVGVVAWPTEDFLSDTLRARRLAILRRGRSNSG